MAYDIRAIHLSDEQAMVLAHARLGHADEIVALTTPAAAAGPSLLEVKGLYGTPLVEACRAAACTPLHVLTVQSLLAARACVDAVDWYGCSALMHAAMHCSVLSPAHLLHRTPAPGVDTAMIGGGGDDAATPPLRSKPPLRSSTPSTVDSARDGAASADSELLEALSPGGVQRLAKPRGLAPDALPRHIQVISMLLNARCDVQLRSRNGVNAVMILAASPSPAACSILEWVMERMCERDDASAAPAAARAEDDASRDGMSHPSLLLRDAAGATLLHYAAYAANVYALKVFMRLVDAHVLRELSRAVDNFHRTPGDVLAACVMDDEDEVKAPTDVVKPRSRGGKGSNRASASRPPADVSEPLPLASRRREFRTLLSLL